MSQNLQQFFKPWFSGIPQNAVKANGTLTFSDVVSDTETVTIGDNTYEFDNNDTYTDGNIQVDMTDYLIQATGTLTFSDVVTDTETVTIGDDIYEFESGSGVTEGNISVDVSGSAVAATGTLTISDVVTDGETVVIGETDTYEFDSDGSITEGNITVDISDYITATGVLTFSDIVFDSETITIGDDTYEFDTGDESITEGNILVDVSSGATVATGVLTFTDRASDGETVTIGTDVFEFDTGDGVTEGNITVDISTSTDLDNDLHALYLAINENSTIVTAVENLLTNTITVTAVIAGSGANTTATEETMGNASWGAATLQNGGNPDIDTAITALTNAITTNSTVVTAVSDLLANTITLTKVGLGDGTGIATTETCNNIAFGSTALVNGNTCSAANAITALIATITASDTVGVGAEDGEGDTVVFTADVEGVVGNSIATTETMNNGAFGAVTLEDGADSTVDAAITALVNAITANSEVVTAIGDTDADTIVLTAVTRGTGGNSVATTETCSNVAFGAETLENGANTVSANDAATILVSAINDNSSEVVSATALSGVLTATYDYVGTDGNSVTTTEDCSNGAWGAETLENGQYAIPARQPGFIIISGVWYICENPVDKWTESGWYSATPTLIS